MRLLTKLLFGLGIILASTTGAVQAQTVIRTIEDLNSVRDDLAGDYVLAKDLDFALASSYAGGSVNTDYRPNAANPADATNAGFAPIGVYYDPFRGTFDGNGYAIRNLYVRVTDDGGLFGMIEGATIHSLGVVDGYVRVMGGSEDGGGLVGSTGGSSTLTNCYATGAVSSTGLGAVGGLVGSSNGILTLESCYATGDVSGGAFAFGSNAGGLVGYNLSGTLTLTNCYATGDVSSENNAGGLVGTFSIGTLTIENCYATGDVSSSSSFSYAGGLVGTFSIGTLTIENCYATGSVSSSSSGSSFAGGLVGSGSGTLTNCYATGSVSGGSNAGGLVGSGAGTLTLTNCYATGSVSSSGNSSSAGGLVGSGSGTLTNCYATGSVSGVRAGGLVGSGGGTITNCYATGDVSSSSESRGSYAGGLVGSGGSGTLTNCYATGSVSGGVSAGGLLGVGSGTSTDSYWDSQTTGQSTTAGTGGTAQTTAQLQGLTAMGTGWNTSIWDFGTDNDYPVLRLTPPPTGWGADIWDLTATPNPTLRPITPKPTPQSLPAMLMPSLGGGGFVAVALGTNRTYTYTIDNVVASSSTITLGYTLAGTNLSTTEAVQVATTSDPIDAPFTLTNGGGFTSADGGVPSGREVQVVFTPPVVSEPMTYTYTITYSGGGVAGNVEVVFVVKVVPTSDPTTPDPDPDPDPTTPDPDPDPTTPDPDPDPTTPDPNPVTPDPDPTTPDPVTPLGTPATAGLLEVVLSPNPTAGVLFVSGIASRVTLLDVSGHVRRAAIKDEARGDVIRLDLNGLPAGLYVARITTPDGVITRRIVKQ